MLRRRYGTTYFEQRGALKMWEKLWASHKQTKQMLSFALLNTKGMELAANEVGVERKGKVKKKGPASYTISQKIGLILGPLLFLLVSFVINLQGLSPEGQAVLGATLWMATWWIAEAVPIPITSLMPIVLLPMFGAGTEAEIASSYGDSILFLFLGGFLIALALEKWNLHQRIAINIISVVGTKTSGIILGFMGATWFLSMWVSNVATVMMMIPIGTAIIGEVVQLMKQNNVHTLEEEQKFTKLMIFGIGFAATIGGVTTLIGTPTNIILVGMLRKMYGIELSFGGWMLFSVPLITFLMALTWLYLTQIALPMKVRKIEGATQFIAESKKKLGKISYEEVVVLVVFSLTAFMWITRTFIWNHFIPGLTDTMIAVVAGFLLFLIPAKKKEGRILNSDSIKDLPWGVLVLVGGGLALATGFMQTDLASWIGSQMLIMEGIPVILVILFATILVLSMTELMPNSATATIMLPIVGVLALAINVHPLTLMVPVSLAAGLTFMLPIGTPSNAIMFATGKFSILDMAKVGFWLNVLSVVTIMIAVYFLLPMIFDIDLFNFPVELK